jgi:hypothetical protein
MRMSHLRNTLQERPAGLTGWVQRDKHNSRYPLAHSREQARTRDKEVDNKVGEPSVPMAQAKNFTT